MKKILLLSLSIITVAMYGQSGKLSEIPGAVNTPNSVSQTKTYTTCGYVQENNAFEDGRVSATAFPMVCAEDFFIPAGECWDINQVITPFFTSSVTGASAIYITFYANTAGAPGAVAGSFTAISTDYTTTYQGTNYGYDIYAYDINLSTPVNLCGGAGGTTYWMSVQMDNSVSGASFYWEMVTSISTYGNNGMNASNTGGPWVLGGTDNFVFTLNHAVTNNLTLTECEGFSITVGTNTYTTSTVVSETLVASGGCDSVVNLDLTILPLATGTDVQTVCESLLWIDGNTYTTDNNTATFTLVGGAASGCDSLVTLDLVVNGPANTVTQTGVQLSADDATAIYQWLDCNNSFAQVASATNQIYTSPINGDFAVEVTANGCVDTSACFNIDYSGIKEIQSSKVSLYPNPGSQTIYLSGLNQLTEISLMTVTSLSGDLIQVYSKPVNQFAIDTLASGVYVITLVHADGIETIRFIKQ